MARDKNEFTEDARSGELEEKLVRVNRVVKVIKGGRIFSFSALTVVGDGNGRVGYGFGKAKEVPQAMEKSLQNARRNMIHVKLRGKTLNYAVEASHGATKIFMSPASEGTGLIAGGAMRAVLELAGVQDVLAKCYGSTNPTNVVRATCMGLAAMEDPADIARRRGKNIAEIVS